jgi:TetR/AcrR family tetracycline transcriptional repressor
MYLVQETRTTYSCQVATTEERVRLSRETVIDGALALADAEGLEGLTIRRLAQHLGVTPMAPYWHFKNKDLLLEAVVNRLWSLVDTDVDPAIPWAARLRALMQSMVGVFRAHPTVTPLVVITEPGEATHCFATMEVALDILASAGFPPGEAAAICRHGLRTATTLAIGDPGLTPRQTPEEAAEFIRRKQITLQTLPPDRYPCIVRAATPLTTIEDPDAFFAFGIDLFIAGVEAVAARHA